MLDHQKQPLQPQNKTSPLWKVLCFLSFVGSVLIFSSCILSSWRVADPIVYHYMDKSTPSSYTYETTLYGLHSINFSNGQAVNTYGILRRATCDNLPYITSGYQTLHMGDWADCDYNCINYNVAKCDVYRKLSFINLLTLILLSFSALGGTLASIWILIFSPISIALQLIWTINFAIAGSILLAWYLVTKSNFESLRNFTLHPLPYVSTGMYLALTGICLIGLCASAQLVASWIEYNANWKTRQGFIMDEILRGGYYPPRSPPPGHPSPMDPHIPRPLSQNMNPYILPQPPQLQNLHSQPYSNEMYPQMARRSQPFATMPPLPYLSHYSPRNEFTGHRSLSRRQLY